MSLQGAYVRAQQKWMRAKREALLIRQAMGDVELALHTWFHMVSS